MAQKKKKTRKSYSPEFKEKAIELAKEIGTREAAEKLGVESYQTLGAWVRYAKKMDEDAEFRELEEAKAEIKKLRKELDSEKKAVSILKDAAAFFCQDQLK